MRCSTPGTTTNLEIYNGKGKQMCPIVLLTLHMLKGMRYGYMRLWLVSKLHSIRRHFRGEYCINFSLLGLASIRAACQILLQKVLEIEECNGFILFRIAAGLRSESKIFNLIVHLTSRMEHQHSFTDWMWMWNFNGEICIKE